MKYIWCLFLCFFLVNAEPPRLTRIIGGDAAKAGQFPYIVAINVETSDSTFFCGGALVTNEWILTAAHCIYGAVLLTIQLGSNYLEGEDSTRVTVATSHVVPHPDFEPSTLENDIGLVRLREPIIFTTYIQTVKLASINLPSVLTPTAVGWGQTSASGPDLSPELQYVSLGIIQNDKCKEIYGNQIKDTMVCVVGNYNEGSCTGDSGSPLVVRLIGGQYVEHVGVASFVSGNGCESTDPSGYTRTYPYLAWINNVTSTV